MKKSEIADKLYKINSWLSGNFVTKIREIKYDDVVELNEILGWLIKEIRKDIKK